MIQLSPQVTTAAIAPEAPDTDIARQNTLGEREKDDTSSFSKLMEGLLKKINTAPGAEHSQEGMTPKKASHLSALKSENDDETEGNEGLAALFAHREGLIDTNYLPRKAEISFDGEETIALENILSDSEEMGLNHLENLFLESANEQLESAGGEKLADADSDARTDALVDIDSLVKADTIVDSFGADVSLNDVSPEDFNQQHTMSELGKQQENALADALPVKNEKQSFVEAHQFNRNAQAALVDADASAEVKLESRPDEKVKDKRRERLSMENAESRIASSQESAEQNRQDSVHQTDESFASQKIDADIIVELRDGSRQGDDRGLARENRNASVFQDMLARELRDGLNTEIVRHASLVLKENGEGLIRLSLRPESLGDIKIRLEMADNKVTGRIVLESEEALKAFEKEIRSLEQSFMDSGFDSASLEMALSSDHGNDGAGQQWKGEEARPFFSERFLASRYDIPIDIDGFQGSARETQLALVDMLV